MRLTDHVHQILENSLSAGDTAIDATAGNGHDALKMATLVSSDGRLIAIDLQDAAIRSTRERLQAANVVAQSEFLMGDHAEVLQTLLPMLADQVSVITFNLGYLPGSDKSVQTTATATLTALDAARHLLKPRGLLLVTAYRGHPGGAEEAESVAAWMQQRAPEGWTIESKTPTVTGTRLPPILWIARK